MAGELNHEPAIRTLLPAAVAYLSSIEAQIPRRSRARRALLAELADGLSDAVQHYVDLGMTCEQATIRVIDDSGPVSVVARAARDVLADGQARLTAVALLLSGPVIGLLWLRTLVPGQWPSALLLRHPPIAVLVVTTIAFGALAVLEGSPTLSSLGMPHGTPAHYAATACASAALCDLYLLMSAAFLLTDRADLGVTGLLAGTASLVRLALVQRIARRDLAAPGDPPDCRMTSC
jgi:hypothetical protein